MKRALLNLTPAVASALAHADQTAPGAALAVPAEVAPNTADGKRLVPLQGVLDTRDLGGLSGHDQTIPTDRFIRSADLNHLTTTDKVALQKLGVTLDVDLRTSDEAAKSPDPLASDPRFRCVRISLLGDKQIDSSRLPPTLGKRHVRALSENQFEFRQVLETLARQRDGAVLFHCIAGKDRTGMVKAILLSPAGVKRDDIVHDYAISASYLKPMMASPAVQDLVKMDPVIAALLGTPPSAIEQFLDALQRG